MTCSPRELFIFADWLLNTRGEPPESVLLRTIINRAYYAALIAARDYTNSSTIGKGGHKNVVDALRRVSTRAASLLDSMRTTRAEVDYQLNKSVTIREAILSMERSRDILYELGEKFPVGPSYSRNFLNCSKFVSSSDT